MCAWQSAPAEESEHQHAEAWLRGAHSPCQLAQVEVTFRLQNVSHDTYMTGERDWVAVPARRGCGRLWPPAPADMGRHVRCLQ